MIVESSPKHGCSKFVLIFGISCSFYTNTMHLVVCLAMKMTFEQGGILIVSHLLRHENSVFAEVLYTKINTLSGTERNKQ